MNSAPPKKPPPFKILDGGVATELENRGHDLDSDLWSAKLLIDHPEEIASIHKQYLLAGADIITSCSYQATSAGFQRTGLDQSEASKLIVQSIELAQQARDQFHLLNPQASNRLVAAGVGPYGAALADGSEYTGAYDIDTKELYDFHRQRWHLMLSAKPDLMLCETTPSIQEAEAYMRLAAETEVPVWVSFSCRSDSEISDGTSIETIALMIQESPVCGIGINCTSPSLVLPLVTRIQSVAADLPILVYPNSGETYEIDSRTWRGTSEIDQFSEMAKSWIRQNVHIIGGCCRTTPAHIQALQSLRENISPPN